MIWFLIACSTSTNSHGDTLSVCMPMQEMRSQKQCVFLAEQYKAISTDLSTRCVALDRRPRP